MFFDSSISQQAVNFSLNLTLMAKPPKNNLVAKIFFLPNFNGKFSGFSRKFLMCFFIILLLLVVFFGDISPYFHQQNINQHFLSNSYFHKHLLNFQVLHTFSTKYPKKSIKKSNCLYLKIRRIYLLYSCKILKF